MHADIKMFTSARGGCPNNEVCCFFSISAMSKTSCFHSAPLLKGGIDWFSVLFAIFSPHLWHGTWSIETITQRQSSSLSFTSLYLHACASQVLTLKSPLFVLALVCYPLQAAQKTLPQRQRVQNMSRKDDTQKRKVRWEDKVIQWEIGRKNERETDGMEENEEGQLKEWRLLPGLIERLLCKWVHSAGAATWNRDEEGKEKEKGRWINVTNRVKKGAMNY